MSNQIVEKHEYRDGRLSLDFYPEFLLEDDAKKLINTLIETVNWPRKFTPGKRCNQTYGDDGLSYDINWYGKTTKRVALPWMECLLPIKKMVEELTSQEYNICVVQYYPSGKVGINPHKDREMTPGTTICGLSLGATRVLKMERMGKTYPISLPAGSLYVFNPPTNDFWTHCIEKDETVDPRVSLTFRNYVK